MNERLYAVFDVSNTRKGTVIASSRDEALTRAKKYFDSIGRIRKVKSKGRNEAPNKTK